MTKFRRSFRTSFRRASVATFATVAIALLIACKKEKPGDSCKGEVLKCLDPKTELICQDGKLIATSCKGPKGCVIEKDTMTCDISGNAEGETCANAHESDAACTADKKQRVVCSGGKYRIEPCRGAKGCSVTADNKIGCDSSLALEGDSCQVEKSYVCSVDHKRVLVCKGGKYVLNEHCRAAKGCSVLADKVDCDRGAQEVGDPCHPDADRECSSDGVTLLVCKSEKWTTDKKCKKKCESTDTAVGCRD